MTQACSVGPVGCLRTDPGGRSSRAETQYELLHLAISCRSTGGDHHYRLAESRSRCDGDLEGQVPAYRYIVHYAPRSLPDF